MSTKLNFTIKKSLKNKFNEKVESDGMFSNSSECLRFLIHDYIKNDSHKVFNKNNIFEIKEVNFSEIENYLKREFGDVLNNRKLNVRIKMRKYKLDELKSLINYSFEDKDEEFREIMLQDLIDSYKRSTTNKFKIPVLQFVDQKQIKKKVPFEESDNLGAISRDEYIINFKILSSIFEGHKELLPNNNLVIEDKRQNEFINILFSLKNIIFSIFNVDKETHDYIIDYSNVELAKYNEEYNPVVVKDYTYHNFIKTQENAFKYISIKANIEKENFVVTFINDNSKSSLKSILREVDQLSEKSHYLIES